MADRIKTKKCPACARAFLKGKRALVSGSMRLVCLACAGNAIRVVTAISTTRCTRPHCNSIAAVCVSCAEVDVTSSLAVAYARPRAALQAMIRASRLFQAPDDLGDEARAFADGKIEGLESALSMLSNDRLRSGGE